MCRSSSCRFMKYHGAFDGFGVMFEFAWFSSGASTTDERITNVIVKTTAAMNSMKTRSGQTSSSWSRSRFSRTDSRPPAAWVATAMDRLPPTYSGRARPPSRRMRQKCTDMKMAASSGNAMTCSV